MFNEQYFQIICFCIVQNCICIYRTLYNNIKALFTHCESLISTSLLVSVPNQAQCLNVSGDFELHSKFHTGRHGDEHCVSFRKRYWYTISILQNGNYKSA